MRDPKVKSYNEPFGLDKPLTTLAVGVVVRSDEPSIKPGQIYKGRFDMSEYAVIPGKLVKLYGRVVENKEGLPWTTLLGACGMPGATAWVGLYDIGKPKKGETIFGASRGLPFFPVNCLLTFSRDDSVGRLRRSGSDCRPARQARRALRRRIRRVGRKGRVPQGDWLRRRFQL